MQRWSNASSAVLVAIVASLAGCASNALEGPYGTQPDAVAKGRALAEQQCASCHAIGAAGDSAFAGAPPFRTLRFDYNEISRERLTSAWHNGGMPPETLSLEQIGDLGAYVRSLRRAR